MSEKFTINNQDILASKLQRHGVELAADSLLAHGLTRHDEGAANVAVLDESLTVSDIELVGCLESGHTTRIRDL